MIEVATGGSSANGGGASSGEKVRILAVHFDLCSTKVATDHATEQQGIIKFRVYSKCAIVMSIGL